MTRVVEIFLLPPFNFILLALLGLLIVRFRRRAGWCLVALALGCLYLASTSLVSGPLTRSLQTVPPLDLSLSAPEVGAIVILGAGVYAGAPEYGGDSLGPSALSRIRYGEWLHRRLGVPILVTGGSPQGTMRSEAELMREVLEEEFGVAVAWVESRSNNTRENATFSYEILNTQGIERIILVTHALHMPRAKRAFEMAGFIVIPAPTMFAISQGLSLRHFLPRAGALSGTSNALREWLGRLWYEISG